MKEPEMIGFLVDFLSTFFLPFLCWQFSQFIVLQQAVEKSSSDKSFNEKTKAKGTFHLTKEIVSFPSSLLTSFPSFLPFFLPNLNGF